MQKTAPDASATLPANFQSAAQWLASLRERRIGAVELLNLHLKQIETHNSSLNLVVALDVEGALAAALRADNRPKSDLPPLHGLPMTVKECYEAEGLPATCGFPFLAENRPARDADAVGRLKLAGAIVFGKTNLPMGAFDWQSYNPLYGVAKNPWNPARTPGGSSGGSAGAIAAAFAPLELGSDIGGSIRVPAHFCGIYGHKPSYGIVPMRGHIPPLPGEFTRYELGVGGPLARTASDLELALDVLAAPGELEQRAWRIALPASRHEQLKDFRVALWADDGTYAVDARCLEAIKSYAEDLRRLGVKVEEARPDIEWQASYETYLAALMPLAGAGMPPPVAQQFIDRATAAAPGDSGYLARIGRVLAMRHFQFFSNIDQRERLYRAWRDFFNRYDLLLCPVFPVVAYEHDQRGDEGATDPITAYEARATIVNGQPRPYLDNLQWPSLAVAANLPATAVPTGRFVDGLPVGVQMIGPYLEDRTPLRFAQLVEGELGGFAPPPALL